MDTNKEQVKKTVHKRKYSGTVVSDKGAKTIVVAVKRTKVHPKYLKRFSVTKRYQVHDEKNQYHEGETVSFIECRPISKTKRWRVLYNTSA